MLDGVSGDLKMPAGTVGHRWQKQKGEWNLKLDGIDPVLELKERAETTLPVAVTDFSDGTNQRVIQRHVPVRKVETVNGPVYVTTAMELYFAHYGVNRGYEGQWPKSYEDDSQPFTPAWQEQFTGVKGNVVVNFAREWARTAGMTGGKCSVIIGAGVNHWYHNNLIYRAVTSGLSLFLCIHI